MLFFVKECPGRRRDREGGGGKRRDREGGGGRRDTG